MIKYIFCKLFGIIRVKNFLVFEDKTFKCIHIKTVPNIIFLKKENEYYSVNNVIGEIINDTLVHNWIYVEKTAKSG